MQVARELEDPFSHPPNDLPAVDLQRDFNARLLAAWDGANVGSRSFGQPAAEGDGAGAAEEEDGVASMLGERASRVGECAWLAESPRATHGRAACPMPRLTRQSSTPNRFWTTSASGASSRQPLPAPHPLPPPAGNASGSDGPVMLSRRAISWSESLF